MEFILVADIGGTHTTLAIIKYGKQNKTHEFNNKRIKQFVSIPTVSYYHIEEIIKEFLEQAKTRLQQKISYACLAVAGPVISSNHNEKVHMPNANKTICANAIIKNTQLEEVLLINDIEALGYAVQQQQILDKYVKQSSSKLKPHRNIALIAIGTGFGCATIFAKGTVQSSEFGHSNAAQVNNNNEVQELITFIKQHKVNTINAIVEIEDIVSGQGLINCFNYVLEKNPQYKQTKHVQNILFSDDKAQAIALSESLPICTQAIKLFVTCAHIFANKYAELYQSKGGIIWAGGIVGHNPYWFSNKKITMKVPTGILLKYEIALFGAAAHAQAMQEKKKLIALKR